MQMRYQLRDSPVLVARQATRGILANRAMRREIGVHGRVDVGVGHQLLAVTAVLDG